MAAGPMQDKALTVVIEKLSEICNRPQTASPTDNRSSHKPDAESSTSQVNIVGIGDGNSTVYHCTDCAYTSHNKYYLRQHFDLVHTSVRPYKCPFCDYAGKRSYALKEHLIVHSSDRPHECVHCHATFRKKGHLSNHLKMHASQLVCSLCQVTCKGKQQLLAHLQQYHSGSGKQVYACDQCFFASNDNDEVTKHLKEHTEPSRIWLKCSVCFYACSTHSQMQTHMLKKHLTADDKSGETGDQKVERNDRSIVEQQAVKTGDSERQSDSRFTYNPESRTFACAICNYTCHQQRTIKSHIWKHSGHKDIRYPMFENGLSVAGDEAEVQQDVESGNELTMAEEPRENVLVIREENREIEVTSEADVGSSTAVDVARQAAVIAQIVPTESGASITPPIDVIVHSSPTQSVRKRRASDSVLQSKRSRIEDEPFENNAERVVVIQNEHDDQQPQLSAIEETAKIDTKGVDETDLTVVETPQVMTEPVQQAKRSGICSSLLAVIEQLREDPNNEQLSRDNAKVRTEVEQKPTKPEKADESAQKENERWGWDKNNLERLSDGHYRCRLCHYQSLQFVLIAQHMKLHKIKQPFECSLCEHVADNSLMLQEHMLQHCKVRTYQCKACNATFNYKSQLRAHCRIHEKEPFTCSICEFESASPVAFRQHLRLHAETDDPAKVVTTVIEETQKAPINITEKREETQGQTDPPPIGKEQKKDDSNKQPVVETTQAKPVEFVRVESKRDQIELKQWQQQQPQQPIIISVESLTKNELQCTQCEFRAISVRSLKSHMKRHINDQRYVEQPLEQYKCTLCGYVCHHLPSLKSHMWRHASDTTYSYSKANDVINAAIDRDSNRTTSVTSTTTTTTPSAAASSANEIETFITFRCIVCGFESTDRNVLSVHMRQHQDVIDKTLEI